jgi:hypothetical protein
MRPAYGFVVSAAWILSGCCSTCGGKCPFSWPCGKSGGPAAHSAAKPPDGAFATHVATQDNRAQATPRPTLATTNSPHSDEYGPTAYSAQPGTSPKFPANTMVPPPPHGISGFAPDLDLSATKDEPWHSAPLPAVSTSHHGGDSLPVVDPAAASAPPTEFRRRTIGVTDTLPRSTYAPVAD